MCSLLVPLDGPPQQWRALLSGCTAISCQWLSCICAWVSPPSSLEHMELSWHCMLSEFPYHFMLIVFLHGCFPECAGRAPNSPVGALLVTPQPNLPLGRFPFRSLIPIRSVGSREAWSKNSLSSDLKVHLLVYLTITAAFNVARSPACLYHFPFSWKQYKVCRELK